jgi:cell division protein FtsN
MRKLQTGGTFLGLVIGIVIGLGAALAVAVYVTKVPIPFVNKNLTVSPEQEAAEARKNKDWDPNAPLAGKNPARAASAPAAAGAATAPPASPATPAPAAPAAPAVAGGPGQAPATKPSADPLGDLAKAKAGSVPVDPFLYFVQAGAFRTPEDAESQRAKLSLMGIEAKVSEREQSGRTVYRVRSGPFERKDEADRVKEKLESSSIEAALVRVQR